MIRRTSAASIAAAALSALAGAAASAQPFAHTYPAQLNDRDQITQQLRDRVEVARPWMRTASARAMADAVDTLPQRSRRWLWSTRGFGERTYTMEQYDAVDAEQKRVLDFFGISELIYYAGWTSDAPFVEFRAYDLAFQGTPLAEPEGLAGARILIVDPAVVTPAWALARLGAEVTVVFSTQRFRALYPAPSDQGPVRGVLGAPDGRVTLVDTNWPTDPADAHPSLGEPFDLIVAVSSLNMGRNDPNPRQIRSNPPPVATRPLGLTRDDAARRLADALAPGGRAMIYSWGTPARPNSDQTPEGDVRPIIRPDHARAAGLEPVAFASDASVFTTMLGAATNAPSLRRPLELNGVTAPQLEAFYAVYARPRAEN